MLANRFMVQISASGSFALFGGGFTSANTAVTDRYTYSSNAVAAGTSLGTARDYLAAAGNATVGIFGGGVTTVVTNVTERYTYSGNTVAAGTSLGTARYGLAATSSLPGGF